MKRLGLIVIMAISFFVDINGQVLLKGKVLAAGTRLPIPLANVFLSSTSVGTISAEDGSFIIQNFPKGRYDLVVSCIGFETYILPLQSDKLPAYLTITLEQKVTELAEVIVEPFDKDGWDKWGSLFSEHFIGTSAFANDCTLENKEAVKFRYYKKSNRVKAFADEPLVFDNQALGYQLKYSLTSFEYDFSNKIFFYEGYPLFEEKVTNKKWLQRRWQSNREDAYKGSLMHFMRSLYRNKLVEQNFTIKQVIDISEAERKRVKQLYEEKIKLRGLESKKISELEKYGFSDHDSLEYYIKVLQNTNQSEVIMSKKLTGDSIAYAQDSATVVLDFTNKLQVTFSEKKAPLEYVRRGLPIQMINLPITSQLRLLSNSGVIVLSNGAYFMGRNLMTAGYWGWSEKIANMLPYEYWPPKK